MVLYRKESNINYVYILFFVGVNGYMGILFRKYIGS